MMNPRFMRDALNEATTALLNGEVPVGCVFVYKDRIIARGGNEVNNTRNATRHAEMICIDQVFEYCQINSIDYQTIFRGVTVIVTVEPCIMCAAAICNLDIKRIIYGCNNDRFGGLTVLNVPEKLAKNVLILEGIQSEDCMRLLKKFYKGKNPLAPPKIRR